MEETVEAMDVDVPPIWNSNGEMTKEENTENEILRKKPQEVENKNASLQKNLEQESDTIMFLPDKNTKMESDKNPKIKDPLQHNCEMERICNNDCVRCCLADICKRNSDITDSCGRVLEKAILFHASSKKVLDKQDLNCLKFMKVLEKTELVSFVERFKFTNNPEIRDTMIGQVWLQIMITSLKTPALMIGRLSANGPGHCEWLCRASSNDGQDIIVDSQRKIETKVNFNTFYDYVKNDAGIELYAVSMINLKKFLEEYKDVLRCNDCDSTDNNIIGNFPSTSTAMEAHENLPEFRDKNLTLMTFKSDCLSCKGK